jgi:hypothetical protein
VESRAVVDFEVALPLSQFDPAAPFVGGGLLQASVALPHAFAPPLPLSAARLTHWRIGQIVSRKTTQEFGRVIEITRTGVIKESEVGRRQNQLFSPDRSR